MLVFSLDWQHTPELQVIQVVGRIYSVHGRQYPRMLSPPSSKGFDTGLQDEIFLLDSSSGTVWTSVCLTGPKKVLGM
jgi:hypothetical protein